MIIELKKAAVTLFLIFSLQMITSFTLYSGAFALAESNSEDDSRDAQNQGKNGAESGDILYRMAPSEFFEKGAVEEKIDPQDINYHLLSAAIFHETNQKRKEDGKEQLSHLPRLDEASRIHARDMAENQYVAHINPREQDLRSPLERVREVGLNEIRFVAENVASHFGSQYESGRTLYTIEKEGDTEYSYQPEGEPIENHTYRSFTESLVDAWMKSPGHRKNILSEKPEFLGTGCFLGDGDTGLMKFYCVQLFFDKFGK